ncbi:MAG TPA: sulfite exporter TauE/SafE family protein [Gemmatimonadaceae bacterium]|nr:sulfite exporter TauE/SafE family protein [Gemmatimonadaceae bacterium]
MRDLFLPAATALTLGALHSLAPDHLTAVSAIVSRQPGWRRAMGLGARWGVGHSLAVVAVGGVLVLAGLELPARFTPLAEIVVGIALVVLSALTLVRALRVHGHWHTHHGKRHWHLHSHALQDTHDHSHRALLGIGLLHGLAGSGAVVILIPSATGSAGRSLLFLSAFALGTIIAMSVCAAVAGAIMGVAARSSMVLHRGVMVLAALATGAVGLWWLVRGGA